MLEPWEGQAFSSLLFSFPLVQCLSICRWSTDDYARSIREESGCMREDRVIRTEIMEIVTVPGQLVRTLAVQYGFANPWAGVKGEGSVFLMCVRAIEFQLKLSWRNYRNFALFFCLQQVAEIAYDSSSVVQEYIRHPFLIGGYKWDLRIYVCITSIRPLRIYAYREGLARFATNKYDLNALSDPFSHLTNVSLNKQNPAYRTNKEQIGQGNVILMGLNPMEMHSNLNFAQAQSGH